MTKTQMTNSELIANARREYLSLGASHPHFAGYSTMISRLATALESSDQALAQKEEEKGGLQLLNNALHIADTQKSVEIEHLQVFIASQKGEICGLELIKNDQRAHIEKQSAEITELKRLICWAYYQIEDWTGDDNNIEIMGTITKEQK